ncbi:MULTISPECIES: hypothetical protein [unclassified Duganella]|uniref:hypothetical protein n=1 Tax=unclassified Duganella TaxID=2636909 RepID=UPI0006F862F3|nr:MULTISPECIES: hypothetical protein [unclassified Duganella]KQV51226.1 hypothetical protein ASD07_09990 [Duganella sp. Root336D2]KRC02986.1 hypothetical protein ASE26_17470 [Duganella sp. Root198D2]
MTKYFAVFLAAFALTACTRSVDKIAASEAGHPPSLWSHHKVLEMPVASCAIKARQALESLNYKQVVQANDSAYGNLGNTRAVVKCAEIQYGSFVYMTVGGADGKAVEKQRNAIASKF